MQNPIVQQVVETIRGGNNVLITVKNSPSVDELTAAIALTLILNHMNKHATTVFSGQVPSTIEFLQPEMAIESNTDSLRDFIIALDKSKADKLRYKVEDNVVRIFITPYRSSISEDDLEFSQGDFNVDVVVALGVLGKDDFDEAVLTHGRILHDATVIAINNQPVPNEVGAVSWQDQQASSISEMVASIADLFGADVVDSQIATALMTGIVAETDRFKNAKTTPQVLQVSSMLMSAGANQQLIAEKLENSGLEDFAPPSNAPIAKEEGSADGSMLDVSHDESEAVGKINIDEQGNINAFDATSGSPATQQAAAPLQDIPYHDDDAATSQPEPEQEEQGPEPPSTAGRAYLKEPPSGGAQSEGPSGLFGSSMHGGGDSDHDSQSVLSHVQKDVLPSQDKPAEEPPAADEPAAQQLYTPPSSEAPAPSHDDNTDVPDTQTLEDIERAVHSPHIEGKDAPAQAEEKVDDYLGSTKPPAPAQTGPVELPALPEMPEPSAPEPQKKDEPEPEPAAPTLPKAEEPQSVDPPPAVPPPAPIAHDVHDQAQDKPSDSDSSGSAPEVPPPMMPQAATNQPQFYESDGSKSNPFLNPKK